MKGEVIECETDSYAPGFTSFIPRLSAFPRVPLPVPYWNGETYQSILQCLISGRVIDGPQVGILRAQIVETHGVADALLCGSGSLALELALRACDVHEGDEVVLPAFCCTSVVPPILSVGATPVLADIGPDLNITAATVEAALTQKTKAVIVPHLFGNPAEIDGIVEFVRGKNIRVIDDAAQALGATLDGQRVGSFGDVGVLSFGAEKVCFGLGGGVVVSRDGEIAAKLFPTALSPVALAPAIAKLSSTIFWRRLRRWTSPLSSLSPAKSVTPDAVPARYRREAMSNLSAAVARSLVQTLDENISARQARVEAYRQLLKDCPHLQLIPHRAGSACLTQVIRILPRRRGEDLASRVIDRLGADGYEVRGSYVPIHLLTNFAQCVWDRLPHAEKVWGDLVELPCEPAVSLDHIRRIASLVVKYLS